MLPVLLLLMPPLLLSTILVAHPSHAAAAMTTTNATNDTPMTNVPNFTLYNDITLPMIGLGSASGVRYPHVTSAIKRAGYKFVDTAQSHAWGYAEEDVGRAVHDAGLRYEDAVIVDDAAGNDGGSGGGGPMSASSTTMDSDYVFVQTKIHPEDLGYESTRRMIRVSLDRLQSSYLDSILIHKPHCWPGACTRIPEGTWHDTWDALMEAMDDGIVRAVGMCDVDSRILDELLDKRITPHIVQNWFDPFHQDREVRRRIYEHNALHPDSRIFYQGYSTLGTQWYHHRKYPNNPVLNDPTLLSIASKHDATVPQVVIQWTTRRGVMALPASTNADHQVSNMNSYHFALSDDDMSIIDDMDGNPPPIRPRERDDNEVSLRFVNRAPGRVLVYWVPEDGDGGGGGDDARRVRVGEMGRTGDALELTSFDGHVFAFEDGGEGVDVAVSSGRMIGRHVVDRSLGSVQDHEIEDWSEEL
jgi:diketogulonate reductase-like aldo/keto reductase